jgi:hypothetical protein
MIKDTTPPITPTRSTTNLILKRDDETDGEFAARIRALGPEDRAALAERVTKVILRRCFPRRKRHAWMHAGPPDGSFQFRTKGEWRASLQKFTIDEARPWITRQLLDGNIVWYSTVRHGSFGGRSLINGDDYHYHE